MKLNKIMALSAASLLMLTGCNKFQDTNVNPNVTETPSTGALLTSALSGMGGVASQTRGGLYAQQLSETQYTEVSLYAAPILDFDGVYAGALYDLQNIIDVNTNEATQGTALKFGSNANQIALARILKAYSFWSVTDRWGDVPYSESLKGAENLAPVYDKQEDIYKDLVKELTEAVAQFDAGPAPTGDIIFLKPTNLASGNLSSSAAIAKWKKTANSLRMLIALRTSKVYPNAGGWAATEFAAAFNDPAGYISSNADNVTLNFPGGAFKNPWFALYDGRSDFAESELLTNYMDDLNDPRQQAFGSSDIGFPYGLERSDATAFNPDYARVLNPDRRSQTSSQVIIGYSYVALAIAEAAQRGWITANVATWYQNGIAASWSQWGVSGDIAAYIAQADVSLGTGDALQKIQLQQYFAFYPDGTQAWANWKRTGVPALSAPAAASNGGRGIPRRYIYGNREYTLNEANAKAAAALYNGDSEVGRMWWDLQ